MSFADAIIASGTGVLGAVSGAPATPGSFTILNNKIQAAVVGPPVIQPTTVLLSRTAPFAATAAVALVATVTAGTVLVEALDNAAAVVGADVGGFSYVILNNNISKSNSG